MVAMPVGKPVGKFTDWNPVIAHPSNVYHSLWRKNSDGCSCPDVRVPDTIIFENGHPSVWYFTAADGQVKRKNSSNVTLGKIELALTKRTVPGGGRGHRHALCPRRSRRFCHRALGTHCSSPLPSYIRNRCATPVCAPEVLGASGFKQRRHHREVESAGAKLKQPLSAECPK